MDKILEVKKLKISFRTNNGTVKAVRDISFDLERGKTLAIVGESGSGKSVTSKAIMGILAGNSIIDGGEILYDGMDLLKITEEEMCDIRGDKIAMIFQDPLSSLNPIVKIGKQITEAMLLKNKISRRVAKRKLNTALSLLKKNMIEAEGSENAAAVNQKIDTFRKFAMKGNDLANRYNNSASYGEELCDDLEDFLFKISKQQKLDVKKNVKYFLSYLGQIKDPFYVSSHGDELATLRTAVASSVKNKAAEGELIDRQLLTDLTKLHELMKVLCQQVKPNFFRIGYYMMKNPSEEIYTMDHEKLNAMTLNFLDKDFMLDFIDSEKKAIAHSRKLSLEKKAALLPVLREAVHYYSGDFAKADAKRYAKTLSKQVVESIDRLEVKKDSIAYTFETGIMDSINRYFAAIKNNPKEEKRFARQSAKRERLIARGKSVDWKVIPMQLFDLEERKGVIVTVIERLLSRYEADVATQVDLQARAVELIDYMKDQASEIVSRISKMMAKHKAIKLMEEVGIHEPRDRYYQYPFEFSGGMRQRIVIAIALAANPDILICDEPTTALDVTIQAQILELINRLKKERNLSVIFITHDLGVVANMADEIAVMYAGKIVEYGTADDVFYSPQHPYTWALLSSMPDLETKEKLDAIPGTPPNMIYPPEGDAFAARNKYAMQIDFEQQPPMFQISDTHFAATWLLHPDAPKVEMPTIISERIERMLKKNGGAQNEQ